MDTATGLAIATIAIVLIFDYTNGFHDASNIVATVIASRAMTPIQAVILVAIFEFLGPLLGGTAVANTIGKFIDVSSLAGVTSLTIILAGVIGAIVWNLGTWWLGIPSSSSHALVGGLVGPVVVSAGASQRGLGLRRVDLPWPRDRRHQGAAGTHPLANHWLLASASSMQRFTGVLLRGARPTLNRHLRRCQIATAPPG